MKRLLLAAALVLLVADLSYGQTCSQLINGAHVRMGSNKWDDARRVLSEKLDECSDNAEYQYLYAVALVQSMPDSAGKSATHLRVADSLLGESPSGKSAEIKEKVGQALAAMWGPMVNDGVRLLQAGNLDEAQAKLELAVETNPQGKEGQLALGAVYQAKGEHDKAIQHLRKALEIDPDYKSAIIRLGVAYQLKAEALSQAEQTAEATATAEQAAAVYEDYLRRYPGDLEVQVQLAGLHATLGHMDRAEPIIREVMRSDSVTAAMLTDFGFRLTQAQKYDLADELLTRAVVMTDSVSVEPLQYLVFVRIQKNDLPGSHALLRKQLELEPSNAEAWEYLAYVERDLGNTDAAQEAFTRAAAIPLQLETLRMLQKQDESWNVEATFSNRTEAPVRDVTVRFTIISEAGAVVETKEARVAAQPLAKGEAEKVTVQFERPAANPRVRYEIVM